MQFNLNKKLLIKSPKIQTIFLGDLFMKISCIKYKKDNNSFKFFKAIGAYVQELEDLEQTDNMLKQLVAQDYRTIIVSNEVAGFSQDIIKKYRKNEDVNIIISPSKRIVKK